MIVEENRIVISYELKKPEKWEKMLGIRYDIFQTDGKSVYFTTKTFSERGTNPNVKSKIEELNEKEKWELFFLLLPEYSDIPCVCGIERPLYHLTKKEEDQGMTWAVWENEADGCNDCYYIINFLKVIFGDQFAYYLKNLDKKICNKEYPEYFKGMKTSYPTYINVVKIAENFKLFSFAIKFLSKYPFNERHVFVKKS